MATELDTLSSHANTLAAALLLLLWGCCAPMLD
jgi:hypothetical protein